MIGSGAADPVLRRVVTHADGWMPLLAPGLDRVSLVDAVARVGELCDEVGRDPDTLPIFGRVYLGQGWQAGIEQGLELGFADFSVGVNRMANPGLRLGEHLDLLVAAKVEIDSIVR